MVKFSEAEKNIAAQQDKLIAAQAESCPLRLYVGNLHANVSERNLQEIFSAFGPVESVNLHKDPVTGQPKGFAFVNYRNAQDGKMAMDQLNGYEVAGMSIKVGLVSETAGGNGDDNLEEGAGVALTAASRAQLMQRLQRDPNAAAAVPAPALPAAPVVPNDGLNHDPGCTIAPMPQCCILLKNMFDPRTETSPSFGEDIKEDVGEECSKYGQVLHIDVDTRSAGFVFVKFDSTQAAAAAKGNLENRWFNQKMITAAFLLEGSYGLRFPAAP